VRVDRGPSEHLVHPVDQAVGYGMLEHLGLFMHLGPVHAHDLDQKLLDWNPDETGFIMPPLQRAMISQLFDDYIPPSPITQPDGSRVSDRYASVIANLGPLVNADLLKLQQIIREKLQKKVIINEGKKDEEVTIAQWFDILHARFVAAERAWANARNDERRRLEKLYPADPLKQNNAYLDWYAVNARAYTDSITAAHNRLLSEFPLREWEGAIAILDTGGDPNLTRARNLLRDLTVPVPPEIGGGDYAPSTSQPMTWSTDLRTSVGELDYLETPQAKYKEVTNAIRAIQAEVLAWTAIMPKISDEDVRLRLEEFQAASQTYDELRTKLAQEWGDSVYVVVEAVCSYLDATQKGPDDFIEEMTGTSDGQDLTENLANAGAAAFEMAGGKADYKEIIKAAGKIMDQHNSVWAAHDATIEAGSSLAGKAASWLEAKGRQSDLQWIAGYIDQLRQRLTSLERMQAEMMQASMTMWNTLWDPKKERKVGKETVNGAFVPLTEKAIPATPKAGDITPRTNLDRVDQPDPYASSQPESWSEVTMVLNKKDMESEEVLKTTFSKRQWGVNFFFGSYGSNEQKETSDFASYFMSGESKIQLRMLVKKVNIRRAWLDPTIFAKSANYFRAHNQTFNLERAVTSDQIQADTDLQKQLHSQILPAYPVSLLIAKDVTIRMNFDFSKTKHMKEYASTIKSSGGGFFLFNTSSVESDTSNREAVSMTVDAGELEVKFRSPQIVGYYLDVTPPDLSAKLDTKSAQEIADAISFLGTLKEVHEEVVAIDEETVG